MTTHPYMRVLLGWSCDRSAQNSASLASSVELFDCSCDLVAFCGALVEVVPRCCRVEELHEAERLEFSQGARDVRSADRLDQCVQLRGCQLLLQGEERALAVRACPDLPDEVPRGCHLVPDDTRVLYRGVANSCHMVPKLEEDMVIIAAFRRADLVRLHTLLACYESPLLTYAERGERAIDLRDHESLRRYVALLLQE
jgi:hypothetical protein